MELSTLTEALSAHPRLRKRIEAIVRTARWEDTTADVTAPIPIDGLAWAVASQLAPQPEYDGDDGEPAGHNVEQAVEAITDDQLKPFILDVALPRLAPVIE